MTDAEKLRSLLVALRRPPNVEDVPEPIRKEFSALLDAFNAMPAETREEAHYEACRACLPPDYPMKPYAEVAAEKSAREAAIAARSMKPIAVKEVSRG